MDVCDTIDDDQASLSTAPILLCEVCTEAARQYKCPRCSMFTCSLACCKQHKMERNCSGQRDRTSYVPISSFSNSNLRNDYHFLEDVLQTKDSAKRTLSYSCGGLSDRQKDSGHGSGKRNLKRSREEYASYDMSLSLLGQKPTQSLGRHTQSVRNFVKAASDPGRNMHVIVMSQGMSRRKANTSQYHSKIDELFWRIHAVFVVGPEKDGYGGNALFFDPAVLLSPQLETSTDNGVSTMNFKEDLSAQSHLVGMILNMVSEKLTVGALLAKFLDPLPGNSLQRHTLRSMRQSRSDVICLMQFIPSPSVNPMFVEISQSSTIREALQGRTIIEYPTFFFSYPKHVQHLRRLIKDESLPSHAGAEHGEESPSKCRRREANENAEGSGNGELVMDDAEGEQNQEDDDAEDDVEFLAALEEFEKKDISELQKIIESQSM